MDMLDFSQYERMPADACWSEHGWGCEAKEGTDVLHMAAGGYEVFVDQVEGSYGGAYACELYHDGDMVGQWFDGTPEDAVRGAFVESVGMDVMREEDNCEDAVNCIAREAYVMLFGDCDLFSMDVERFDALLGVARRFVKSHVKWVGYEWEEF